MVHLAWMLLLLAAHITDAQPNHPCRRQYVVEEKRTQQLADLGNPRGAVGSIGADDFARQLGFELLPYSRSQERAFHARMEQVKIHATPWLYFGRDLFDFGQTRPDATMHPKRTNDTHAMFFYGNHFVDLSLFTHFFAKPEPIYGGTYVEIGGGNGVHASNTLFFEQHLNWKGYMIEPTPCAVCMLPVTRPRDVNIKAGCCLNSTTLDGSFMLGFCAGGQDSCILNEKMGGYKAYSAPCEPMSTLLSDGGKLPPHIDLLSIDVEENYMAVLESWPWEHTAVDVMIVEVAMDPKLKKKLDAGAPKHKQSAAHKEQAKKENARVRAYLERKGYHVLREPFQYDLVAVRKACTV